MQKNETLKLLTLIQSSYDNFLPKNHETQKMFIDLWNDSLSDLSYEDCLIALKKHMQESVYVPKVADIYQRVISKNIPVFPDPVEEFNIVLRACNKFGQMRSIEAMNSFNEYTRKVVEMNGGFRKFCMAQVDDEISDRKHFTETYQRLIEREIKTIKNGGNSFIQLASSKTTNELLESKIGAVTKDLGGILIAED